MSKFSILISDFRNEIRDGLDYFPKIEVLKIGHSYIYGFKNLKYYGHFSICLLVLSQRNNKLLLSFYSCFIFILKLKISN